MSTLAERIQAKAPELGRRAIAEMYQNPFWQERFGARGRELSDKDGELHVSYLVQALLASEASVLTGYARWLQTLLVSRGLCTRHIDENFERLARAIGEQISEPEPALALLGAARQALVYESGPARELMLQAEPLAERVVDALASRQPAWFSAASSYSSLASFESIHQAESARFKADVLEYIAYLADAVHAKRAELFVVHVAWMQGFLARRKGPGARVEEMLHALCDCLPGAPPGPASPAAALPSGAVFDAAVSTAAVANPLPRPSSPAVPRRPPLSQPPAPTVPLAVSAELAARARAVLGEALERLARDASQSATTISEGVAS